MLNTFEAGFRLDGKIALITGAAAGIGYAIAELFAAQGARLALLDMSAEIPEVARQLPGEHLAISCNVSDLTQIHSAVNKATEKFGTIDILVNNAGVALLNKAAEVNEQEWDTTMAVNLKAPFFLSQAVAKVMAKNGGGQIVNLASQASVVALDRHVAYCSSKAALVSMTEVLAIEWAGSGITVNAISPTVVETALGKKAWAGEVGVAMKKKIPVGRFAQPEEVASAVLYLVSKNARMMTGANVVIDGGYTIQ
ncbi:MAG: D-threitol dehydrogenase [Candidatus Accumulibacter sp.]|nr:D-threitol dehydrogenase [Accumulibacter sp.]